MSGIASEQALAESKESETSDASESLSKPSACAEETEEQQMQGEADSFKTATDMDSVKSEASEVINNEDLTERAT